jgi:hypothetical protein
VQLENVRTESETAVVRDMDLVRTLILAIEQDPELDGTCEIDDYEPERLGVENHSKTEVVYHLDLLISAGVVDGKINGGGYPPTIRHLTWQGHDFAASMKNGTVWGKARAIVKEKGGDFTVSMLSALIEKLLKQHFGLE